MEDDNGKENNRLQTEMTIHLTYDKLLEKVEKKSLGAKLGGQFPLNQAFQATIDKYLTVGQILEYFFEVEGASKDPKYQYIRDQFYFNNQQAVMQAQQMEDQKKQAQQIQDSQKQEGQQQEGQPQGQKQQGPGEIETGVDQLTHMLGKSENLSTNKKHIMAQQLGTVKHILNSWEEESKAVLAEFTKIVDQKSNKK